jgi:hypothetical protein
VALLWGQNEPDPELNAQPKEKKNHVVKLGVEHQELFWVCFVQKLLEELAKTSLSFPCAVTRERNPWKYSAGRMALAYPRDVTRVHNPWQN